MRSAALLLCVPLRTQAQGGVPPLISSEALPGELSLDSMTDMGVCGLWVVCIHCHSKLVRGSSGLLTQTSWFYSVKFLLQC